MQKVNGNSLKVKHVAQVENGDYRNVGQELEELDVGRIKKGFYDIRKMHFAQTLNTDVVCRVCFGTKYVVNKGQIGESFINLCPHCKGTRRMKAV